MQLDAERREEWTVSGLGLNTEPPPNWMALSLTVDVISSAGRVGHLISRPSLCLADLACLKKNILRL
jgi:hypothetical protein